MKRATTGAQIHQGQFQMRSRDSYKSPPTMRGSTRMRPSRWNGSASAPRSRYRGGRGVNNRLSVHVPKTTTGTRAEAVKRGVERGSADDNLFSRFLVFESTGWAAEQSVPALREVPAALKDK